MTPRLLTGSAVFAVFVGTAVYLLDRSWSSVLFLAPFDAWQPDRVGLFGALGYSLPSLMHAYTFALLLILALMPSRAARWLGPLAWLVVAAGLELLQADAAKAFIVEHFSTTAGTPVAGTFYRYAFYGNFDVADLVATAIGVFAAWLTSFVLEKEP